MDRGLRLGHWHARPALQGSLVSAPLSWSFGMMVLPPIPTPLFHMCSPHAWARTLCVFSSSPSGGVWLVCNRHSAPFTVATPIVWWPSKPVSTAGPNIALSVTGPNCRSNERLPKFVKRTSLAKTLATNSATVATSAPLPTTRRNSESCAAIFSLVLLAATSILASRAISQKSVACLSNTLVVAPRKTPQLSPASNNGLALIGEKIRRGISRHGANTSRDASASAAQSAPWTVLPSCRARALMLEVRPGDRRRPLTVGRALSCGR